MNTLGRAHLFEITTLPLAGVPPCNLKAFCVSEGPNATPFTYEPYMYKYFCGPLCLSISCLEFWDVSVAAVA